MIPITKPTMPKFEDVSNHYREIFETGLITQSKYVSKFEDNVKKYLSAKHAVALSSCTAGLMLSMKVLKLKGEVILPSFTFCATAHAVMWNNLRPKFADIEPEHYCIDPEKVNEAITKDTSAILAVHMFGHPANIKVLEEIAKDNKIKLIFDAAHAFGSKLNDEFIGDQGDATIFSFSPTKLLTTAEGGILITSNEKLCSLVSIGRNYGDPGDYDCLFPGFNARMSEFHAILGLKNLELLEENIRKRNELVSYYKKRLSKFSGISYQKISTKVRSTFKDFSIYIEKNKLGIGRDELFKRLLEKGVEAKKYFYPPVHKQKAYTEFFKEFDKSLPITNDIADNVLSLPLYSHMSTGEIDIIINVIEMCVKNG